MRGGLVELISGCVLCSVCECVVYVCVYMNEEVMLSRLICGCISDIVLLCKQVHLACSAVAGNACL